MDVSKLIALAESAARVVASGVSIVTEVQQQLNHARADLSVTDIQAIESRLADAHASTLRMSRTLDDKLKAAGAV